MAYRLNRCAKIGVGDGEGDRWPADRQNMKAFVYTATAR
jgi:hypothetical protein